jgi:hypothetical protein
MFAMIGVICRIVLGVFAALLRVALYGGKVFLFKS